MNHLTHRRMRFETLEDRRVLSATFQDAGIDQQAIDAINNSQYSAIILADETLHNTLDAVASSETAPAGATVLNSVGDLSQITAGTVGNPNVYLIQGDLTVTSNIDVPSNVHIYVDGSIFKQGTFTAPGGVHSVENGSDAIFFLDNADNVKLVGIDNALLHSNPNLAAAAPHATAIYIGNDSDNVEVDGFEIANVWEGVVARSGGLNIDNTVIKNNYIRNTVGRAIWSIGSNNLEAAHNFIENAGVDGLDWDAFTNAAIGYENVVIGAGRWAGFVEEAAHDSYFIRGLSLIVDLGNPNRGFMLGWADNGTTINVVNNSGQQTRHNYFIDNVVFDPGNIPNSGGDYFAKANSGGKGPTYFWANRGFGAGQSQNNFDNAEWLTVIPTAGGRDNAVNGVQLLEDLDLKYNGPGNIGPLAGDFDENFVVEAADLGQWQGDFGANGDSDANGDGESNGFDFLAWQRTFGNEAEPQIVYSYQTDFTAAEGFSNGDIGFGGSNPDAIVGQGGYSVDTSGTGTLNANTTGFNRAIFGLTFGDPDPFDRTLVQNLGAGDVIELEARGMVWNSIGTNLGVFGLADVNADNILGSSNLAIGVQFTTDGASVWLDTDTSFAANLEVDTGIALGTPFDYLQRLVANGDGTFDIEHRVDGALLATTTSVAPVFDDPGNDTGGFWQDFGQASARSVDGLSVTVTQTLVGSASDLAASKSGAEAMHIDATVLAGAARFAEVAELDDDAAEVVAGIEADIAARDAVFLENPASRRRDHPIIEPLAGEPVDEAAIDAVLSTNNVSIELT